MDIARENTRQREGHSARTVAALIRSYWVNGGDAIQNEPGVKTRVSAHSEIRRGAALSNVSAHAVRLSSHPRSWTSRSTLLWQLTMLNHPRRAYLSRTVDTRYLA